MMKIYTNGYIAIDGKDTGLGVQQKQNETVVYVRDTDWVVRMPLRRYSLAHPKPLSGAAGLDQFEADLKEVGSRLIEASRKFLERLEIDVS